MARPKRSTSERVAEQLLAGLNMHEVPVPVYAVADHLGISVVYRPMGDVSGMTYRNDEQVVIGLNSQHHARRQRFTAAHELGHAQLHKGRPLTVDSTIRVNFRDQVSSMATDAEEIEANAFAAALLMPSDAVIASAAEVTAAGIRSRERIATQLARRFDVSPEAMGYRLINLGIASAP